MPQFLQHTGDICPVGDGDAGESVAQRFWTVLLSKNICLKKTIAWIEHCLPKTGSADAVQLRRAYDLTLRLQSQLPSVIYGMEMFSGVDSKRIVERL